MRLLIMCCLIALCQSAGAAEPQTQRLFDGQTLAG
jgi:hypothetical protein